MKGIAATATTRTDPRLVGLPLVPCPAWADADKVRELFGLAPKHLAALTTAGAIRKRKMGTAKQAAAIWSCFDIIEWLEGNEPFPVGDDSNVEGV